MSEDQNGGGQAIFRERGMITGLVAPHSINSNNIKKKNRASKFLVERRYKLISRNKNFSNDSLK